MEGYMSGQKVKPSPKDKVSKPPSRKPTAGDGSASSPSASPAKSSSRFPQTDSPRGASKDPMRLKHLQEIATLRERYRVSKLSRSLVLNFFTKSMSRLTFLLHFDFNV
jgi:hypothetical protein